MRRLLPMIFVAVLLAACAGEADTAAGRFGIDGVTWPKQAVDLQRTFEALPETVGGLPRTDAYWLTAVYGEGDQQLQIFAVDLGGAECPGLEGSSLVRSTLEEEGKLKVEQTSPQDAPEGDPVWIEGRRPGGVRLFGWSVPGCRWVLAVEGPDATAVEAGVRAIVDTQASVDSSS